MSKRPWPDDAHPTPEQLLEWCRTGFTADVIPVLKKLLDSAGPDVLTQLRVQGSSRRDRWHPPESEPWSVADWSNAMCGEAGEAANLVKKLRRIETGTQTSPSMVHNGHQVPLESEARILAKSVGLELADIVAYADLLAQELTRKYGGYHLSDLIVTKFNAVSHREGFPERIGGLA